MYMVEYPIPGTSATTRKKAGEKLADARKVRTRLKKMGFKGARIMRDGKAVS
jgi:hypothetical protein